MLTAAQEQAERAIASGSRGGGQDEDPTARARSPTT